MPTVEGIFRIIDRASAPMQRMERQARQTDRAIERLAFTTDMVGGQKQQRQMDGLDRSYRTFGRTLDDTGGRVRRLSRDVDQNESKWSRLRNSVTQVGGAIMGFGRIIGLIKLPAMGVGIGVLVQAVGALAGGIIALLPRITDLAGGVGVLGPTIVGAGLAMVTLRLATHGLTQALAGNQAAFKKLTPEAKQFVTTLHSYGGILKELKASAQGGLFGGLDTALPRLTRGLPVANALLQGMSRTLGQLAVQAANRFTTPQFLQDLLGIGRSGTQTVGRAGTALINILSGMRNLTVAALPFTDAVTKALVRFSEWFDRWSQFQRDSGRAAAFFERSRKSFDQFGRILGNLWTWFGNLGRAARGTGDTLWAQAERATRAWAKWSGTLEGQIKLTRTFVGMRASVAALVTLFDDLVRAIFGMGASGGLPGIINSLDRVIPPLVSMLNTLANQWGPILANVLVQIADTLNWLVSGTGPLTIFLTLLDEALRLLNGIVNLVPGLNHVLGAAFSVVAIGLFINKLRGVAAGWFGVTSAANTAAAAEARALALAGGGGAGGTGGVVAGAAAGSVAGRVAAGGLATGEAVTAGGVILPAGVSAGGAAAGAAGLGLGAKLAARGGGLLRGAGAVVSKFALPVTLALGAFGGLTAKRSGNFFNQVGQTDFGIVNAATAGLAGRIPVPGSARNLAQLVETPDQAAQRNVTAGMGTLHNQLAQVGGDAPKTLDQLNKQIALYTAYTQSYGQIANPVYRQTTEQLKQQLSVLTQVRHQVQLRRDQESRAAGYRVVRQEGAAFDVYSAKLGPVEAARRTSADVLNEMSKLQEPGRRILAQQYTSWLQEESRRNPALVGQYRSLQQAITQEYAKLGINIRIVNGQIVEGTQKDWNAVARSMKGAAERAREAVNTQFTAIQDKAVAVLIAMGVSSGGAHRMVQAIESGQDPTGVQGAPVGYDSTGRAIGSNTVSTHTPGSTSSMPPAWYKTHGQNTTGKPQGGPVNNAIFGTGTGGLKQGITTLADDVLNRFPGLAVTSTLRPGDKGSYHSIGEAVDLAGPPSLMTRAARWIGATMGGSLLEGIHNPGLSIKNGQPVSPGFWGASTWAGHANHIHLAAGNAAGLGGGALGNIGSDTGATNTRQTQGRRVTPGMLAPRRSGLAGVPGTLADQLGMLYATQTAGALTSALNTGPALGSGRVGQATSTLTGNKKLAYSMMSSRWPASEWTGGLLPLWTGESNFNNKARNTSSGAFGIPQALPASKMGAAAVGGDPVAQIAWGLNYIGGRYGTPTAAYKQWLSRKPHWYHDGGSAVYRRPTLIGVGDNPRGEKVSVTPLGGKSAGSTASLAGMSVVIEHIDYHGPGDIRKVVMEEFRALARELENGGLGTEESM